MAKSLFSLFLFLLAVVLFGTTLHAQIGPSGGLTLQPVTVAPSGTCANTALRLYTPSGAIYSCQNGTWGATGGGGGGTCSSLAGVITGTCAASTFAASPAFTGTPTVPNPAANTNTTQIASTSFVQSLIGALNQAVAVQAATVSVLSNTPAYSNGTAGVGATLTASTNGALTIDGYTVLLNDRILVNNQASALQNGVYTLTTLGTGGVHYVLTRATDYNTPTAINTSGAIPVLNGTVNNNILFVLSNSVTTIGVTAINYSVGAATPVPAITITNASSTGTTLNKLVKLTGAPSTAVIAATTDTSGIIGICGGNCGTSGGATILESGTASCIFDGATTANHFVQISSSTTGDCHDGGATFPSTGQVIGRVLTTNAAGGTYTVLLFSPDVASTAAATPHAATFSISGNGSTIVTGALLVNFETENAGTIYKVVTNGTATAGPANCSITVDIWKAANAIPTNANKISASAPATLSTAQLSTDTTLTGWTTAVAVGDVFSASVASVTGCVSAYVQVWWR